MRTLAFLFAVGLAAVGAQTNQRLPLPADTVTGALVFETTPPAAGVLTGLLLPAAGPLSAWAPVWSLLGADGTLVESQTGAWVGTRPAAWRKLAKAGFVVAGMRLLIKTGPAPVTVQQLQVFWRPWTGGAVAGATTVGPVVGSPARGTDTVKVVELTVPEGAIPVGLWGQTVAGVPVQVSLLVRLAPSAPQATGTEVSPPQAGPSSPRAPSVPPVTLLNSP